MIRPPGWALRACPYTPALKAGGVDLLECATLAELDGARRAGCRVGLLALGREADAAQLAACTPFLDGGGLVWIGLVARELLAQPHVRACIAEYLLNFVATPADPAQVILALRHALGMAMVRQGGQGGQREPGPPACGDGPLIVGSAPPMLLLAAQIRKIARTDAAVLIKGQSGTGKELAARAIHQQSRRADAPFVAVNCGAIAPQLFQSELFGHEKGAFTGAVQRRIGRIEAASGGTLLLDEIGDMPPDMQVGLLRFLQEKTIERVGGHAALAVDVRLIAATHVDLAEAVRQGRFREDLYYRIDVVSLTLPTLAERGADIETLARHYLGHFSALYNKSLRGFSRAATEAMLAHAWPGNVRELVNRVQRATVLAEGRFVQPADLGFGGAAPAPLSLEEARSAAEQLTIGRALVQGRNRIAPTAALLGVSRVTLYRLLEKHGMRAPPGQSRSPEARTRTGT
ncbi:sigma-54 dependent transcriptional regulator [Janthinobacterium sp.]|uniref:sigma-54 interaction domain-containing protein n=1 Tax=Janthinobacterium sp. TaxID=1871054 RepID=UPI00293D4F9C|nr:sigma-54 dependent transcriptional regulator [Janthinobacterium sp.]